MNRYIDADVMIARASQDSERMYLESVARHIPSIDTVWCKECKHRPIKEDPNGENYGFNLIEPKDGNKRCPLSYRRWMVFVDA